MDASRSRRERLLLLALLLVFLVAFKAAFNPSLGRNSLDGDYYYQIARHVAEGDGLLTSVSLYHQGFKQLPHPTPIYPLWPLVMGVVGSAVGLPLAASVLPELLYLLDLVLLYFLANRLAARLGWDGFLVAGGGTLDLGHLAVALFGTNPVFFQFTSLPYTEALAFALLFTSLLVLDRAVEGGTLGAFAVAGCAGGLALATRSQAVMLLVAAPMLLAAAGLHRRRFLLAAAVFALFAAAVLLPWVAWVSSFVDSPTPRTFLTVGSYRETPELETFGWSVPTSSRLEYAANRLRGVAAAFDPSSGSSYATSFGPVAWLVPAALLALLLRPGDLRRGLPAALRPPALAVTVTLASGLLMIAPLHLLHSRFLWEWRFGHRHGLPFLLLLVPALAYLLRRGGPLRLLALALAGLSLVTGALGVARLLTFRYPPGPQGAERELVEWLGEHPRRPIVVTTNAQPLAVYSRAGFHWMECREDSRQTRVLLEVVGADYVVVYPGEERCPFVQGVPDLALARTFEDGRGRIFVLAPASTVGPAAAPHPQ
jgi:hypothetical protein